MSASGANGSGNKIWEGIAAPIRRLTNGGDMYWVFAVLLMAAAGVSILYGIGDSGYVKPVALMMAGALFTSGCFVGFLFGIPKSNSTHGVQVKPDVGGAPTTGAADSVAQAKASGGFTINNNLEEISDWLTKMVVGVGLTQFELIKNHVVSISVRYGSLVGSQQLALAMIIFFFVCGFMFGYLWTTLFYAAALGRAKQAADLSTRAAVADAVALVQDLAGTQRKNTDAITQVTDFLDPRQDATPAVTAAMQEAVKSATSEMRTRILAQVGSLRSDKWKNDKAALVPIVPVLEALIAADPNNHRSHGELGFVLKDQPSPDLAQSIKELSTAIDLRKAAGEQGWLNYEFNRALARIILTPSEKAAILADFRAAAPKWRDNYASNSAITNWLNQNNLSVDNLIPPGTA